MNNEREFECDWANDGLVMITEEINKLLGYAYDDPSYGSSFKNDVFEMFPYYWGECTCGKEEKESIWLTKHDHTEGCFYNKFLKEESRLELTSYQWRLYNENMKRLNTINQFIHDKYPTSDFNYFDQGLEHKLCDCGYSSDFKKFLEDNQHIPSCALVKPNFKHFKTGLEISWYKYIGRDQTSNMEKNNLLWIDILHDCIHSIQQSKEDSNGHV